MPPPQSHTNFLKEAVDLHVFYGKFSPRWVNWIKAGTASASAWWTGACRSWDEIEASLAFRQWLWDLLLCEMAYIGVCVNYRYKRLIQCLLVKGHAQVIKAQLNYWVPKTSQCEWYQDKGRCFMGKDYWGVKGNRTDEESASFSPPRKSDSTITDK